MIQTTLPRLEFALYGKRCSKCGKAKPLKEYHKNGTHKDGLTSRCKVCTTETHRAYRGANKSEIAASKRAYNERHKEEIAVTKRTYYEAHKTEIAAKKRVHYEAHREEEAARKRAYRQTPKGHAVGLAAHVRRRLLPIASDLTAAMIEDVQAASDGICQYCGEPFTDGHIDHIIPVSKGGTNARENLVYCCAPCNCSKGDKMLDDWRQPDTASEEQ